MVYYLEPRHDAWKDSYDAWKLRSPDDEYPEEECFHEDYEANSEGRATCCRCGESWWLTDEQIRAERANNEAYDKMMRREERREWWRERWHRLVSLVCFWRRWRKKPELDDEIPF